MIKHHAPRRLPEPLKQRKVPELVGPEYLQHLERLVANVLHKVAHVLGHDAHVARDVVKRPGVPLGREDGDARAPADEERPLVRHGVPVHLAQRPGLDDDVRGRHRLGDGEVGRVGDAHEAPGRLLRRLVQHPVRELVFGRLGVLAARALVVDGARAGAAEDVLLAGGQVREDSGVELEVLGDDGLGRVCCVLLAFALQSIC